MSQKITPANICVHFFSPKIESVVNVTFDKAVGIRLHQFILILKISQNAFAQSIDVSRGFLNDVLKGRKGLGGIPLANVAKAYKHLNIRWLLTGEGEMFEYVTLYENPPPELKSGQPDMVEEGVKIQYIKKEGELERIKRLLDEHEQRLRVLEGRK